MRMFIYMCSRSCLCVYVCVCASGSMCSGTRATHVCVCDVCVYMRSIKIFVDRSFRKKSGMRFDCAVANAR
jgi:hypothetical protein